MVGFVEGPGTGVSPWRNSANFCVKYDENVSHISFSAMIEGKIFAIDFLFPVSSSIMANNLFVSEPLIRDRWYSSFSSSHLLQYILRLESRASRWTVSLLFNH